MVYHFEGFVVHPVASVVDPGVVVHDRARRCTHLAEALNHQVVLVQGDLLDGRVREQGVFGQ